MKRICVFCGSSMGNRPEYRAAPEELGAELVRRNIGLVYGGGNVGLMGVLADAVLRAGGEAVGVIPKHLMAREAGTRADEASRCALDARTQGAHGRPVGRLRRVAGRVRDSGGVLRGGNLDATRSACEALRCPECLGVLHSVAGDVRPCGGGAISEDGEPRASAGAGVGCGLVAGTGTVASGAGGEMAGSGHEMKECSALRNGCRVECSRRQMLPRADDSP